MENLILPVAMIAIVVIGALSAYVADDPARKERAWKIFTLTLVAVVLTVTLSILFGGILYGYAHAEEEGVVVEYTPDEYLIEAADENEILIKVPYEGKWLSLYWDTIDESFKPTKLWVRIVDGEFCVDADYVEEEPEPIGFPPVLLLGAIAPIEKKFKRAQKMPPDFYLPCSLFDKNTLVVYFTNGKKCFVKVELSEALEYVRRASTKGIAAFVCTFVEEYKQQAVVACNYCDFLEYWRGTAISDKINDAYKALTVGVITNNVDPKLDINEVKAISKSEIKDKDDPIKMIVKVRYSRSCSKLYTFICRSAHFVGDYVTVEYNNGTRVLYKNAEVGFVGTMKQSELDKLAKSLGREEIAEVYCEQAIDTEEAWEEWGGKDPKAKIDPEDDSELYAPSPEEIAEFEAMREAYTPGYRNF